MQKSLPQERAAGSSQFVWSLALAGREQLRCIGITVMRMVVVGEARGRLHDFRMLRTQRRQEFSLRSLQQRLTLSRLVFRDQDPAQARLGAGSAPISRS